MKTCWTDIPVCHCRRRSFRSSSLVVWGVGTDRNVHPTGTRIGFSCSQKRGFGMLGLLSLIALLATLCAAVSISSMRSATGSLRGLQRLQTQAAAEGAAVLLATGDAASSGTIKVGDVHVLITPETTTGAVETTTSQSVTSATVSRLAVSLRAGERVTYSRNFLVRFAPDSGAISVEALP